MTAFLTMLSGMLAWIALIVLLIIAGGVILELPESPLGRELHRRYPRTYRFLTGLDEWRGDEDDHLWRGGPPAL